MNKERIIRFEHGSEAYTALLVDDAAGTYTRVYKDGSPWALFTVYGSMVEDTPYLAELVDVFNQGVVYGKKSVISLQANAAEGIRNPSDFFEAPEVRS